MSKPTKEALDVVWGGKTVHERLNAKTRITPGCWIWTGEKGGKGYGRMQINKRYWMAHRLSYEIHFGPIPDGMIICHTCDNPPCVNPDHLWVGTDKENSDDKMRKGRWSCGTRKAGQTLSYAKLTDEEIYAIRADPRSYSEIGRAYGIAIGHTSDIKLRKRWAHLPPRADEQKSVDGRARPARLTIDEQRSVRDDKRSRKQLALEFGVSRSVIGEIQRCKGIYSHLATEL